MYVGLSAGPSNACLSSHLRHGLILHFTLLNLQHRKYGGQATPHDFVTLLSALTLLENEMEYLLLDNSSEGSGHQVM